MGQLLNLSHLDLSGLNDLNDPPKDLQSECRDCIRYLNSKLHSAKANSVGTESSDNSEEILQSVGGAKSQDDKIDPGSHAVNVSHLEKGDSTSENPSLPQGAISAETDPPIVGVTNENEQGSTAASIVPAEVIEDKRLVANTAATSMVETFEIELHNSDELLTIQCPIPATLSVLMSKIQAIVNQDDCRLQFQREGRVYKLQTQEHLEQYLKMSSRPNLCAHSKKKTCN